MQRRESVPVLIAGGGPVGLTTAMDLGWRGTECLVVEEREGDPPSPRCNTTNARSMEHFRRLGVARRVREAGLPHDHPTDVAYVTTVTGHELARFPLPPSGEILDAPQPDLPGWPTPEPQHRICQVFLEPILRAHVETFPAVSIRTGWRIESVTQDADGVDTTIVDVKTGESRVVRSAYLVGCDGGRSTVRRELGVALEGDALVGDERVSLYFRSPELAALQARPTWMYWWFTPHYRGTLIALDGRELFMLQIRVPPGEDPAAVDPEAALVAAVGRPVEHESIEVAHWTPRRLVAGRFRVGRAMLAGDAAHLWLASGGFGMNTGIGDATALAWRLDAVLRGWGGDRLLDDYAMERRSLGEETSQAALTIDRDTYHLARDCALLDENAEGARLRRQAGEAIERVDRKQWHSQGVQLGLEYHGSPGIADGAGGAVPTERAIDRYEPSVRPGARLPHYWRASGASIHDDLGPDFTIIRVGADAPDAAGLLDAAAELGVPLAEIVADEPQARALYTEPLVLVRPDQHVAWSGRQVPERPRDLLARLVGRAPEEADTRTLITQGEMQR